MAIVTTTRDLVSAVKQYNDLTPYQRFQMDRYGNVLPEYPGAPCDPNDEEPDRIDPEYIPADNTGRGDTYWPEPLQSYL